MVITSGRAPLFSIPNQNGVLTSLDQFEGKWIVLYFYPRDNTPGCSIEGQDFTRLSEDFEKEGSVVFGVSCDSVESHCKFIKKKDLGITLLSDEDHAVCDLFGVWAPKKFMGREFLGVVRSTFLINPSGEIAYVWSPVRVKGHADEVLGKLREIN